MRIFFICRRRDVAIDFPKFHIEGLKRLRVYRRIYKWFGRPSWDLANATRFRWNKLLNNWLFVIVPFVILLFNARRFFSSMESLWVERVKVSMTLKNGIHFFYYMQDLVVKNLFHEVWHHFVPYFSFDEL